MLPGRIGITDKKIDITAEPLQQAGVPRSQQPVIRPAGQPGPVFGPLDMTVIALLFPGTLHMQGVTAVTRFGDHQTTHFPVLNKILQHGFARFRLTILGDRLNKQRPVNTEHQSQRQRFVRGRLNQSDPFMQMSTPPAMLCLDKGRKRVTSHDISQHIRRKSAGVTELLDVFTDMKNLMQGLFESLQILGERCRTAQRFRPEIFFV